MSYNIHLSSLTDEKESYDSHEELTFKWWLDELKENNYIKDAIYQPESFELFDPVSIDWMEQLKTKIRKRTFSLLKAKIYTGDFKILWNNAAKDLFFKNLETCTKIPKKEIIAQDDISWVDVKGGFGRHASHGIFSINQKWVWQKEGIYVQKIVPFAGKTSIFARTFCPQKFIDEIARKAKRAGKRAKKWDFEFKTIKEFVNSSK